jgi:hypothetical protein
VRFSAGTRELFLQTPLALKAYLLPIPLSVRILIALSVGLFWFWLIVNMTTMGWGLTEGWWRDSLRLVLGASAITCALSAPFYALPFIGCRWRGAVTGVLITGFIPIFAGESFGRLQEWLVIQKYGLNPGHGIHVSRWSPVSHHEIAYVSGFGWTGWD